mmetsp:Transcript_93823/g.162453  ORF Transcript_93823/g.162453 Transcript_93823/m.162453 type:complete len:227 (+) Transcript_93823:556-1236(+)
MSALVFSCLMAKCRIPSCSSWWPCSWWLRALKRQLPSSSIRCSLRCSRAIRLPNTRRPLSMISSRVWELSSVILIPRLEETESFNDMLRETPKLSIPPATPDRWPDKMRSSESVSPVPCWELLRRDFRSRARATFVTRRKNREWGDAICWGDSSESPRDQEELFNDILRAWALALDDESRRLHPSTILSQANSNLSLSMSSAVREGGHVGSGPNRSSSASGSIRSA